MVTYRKAGVTRVKLAVPQPYWRLAHPFYPVLAYPCCVGKCIGESVPGALKYSNHH